MTMPGLTVERGIRTRHQRKCEGEPCDCRPFFEARIWSRVDQRDIIDWFDSIEDARSWREEMRERLRGDFPTSRQRDRARRRAAEKALARQEREAAVRQAGGSVAEGYSLIRRTLQALDAAARVEEDTEARRALRDAVQAIYAAEDLVVKAVRLHA